MTIMPIVSPFLVDPDHRFVFDPNEFMDAIDLPAFIASPSAEFRAAEIEPLLRTLFSGSRA
jgi:hypothetical protein